MSFVAHDFSNEHLYWPRIKRQVRIAEAPAYQVMYRRTVVGFYNVYFVDHPDRPYVNLTPECFHAVLPDVDPRASTGCRTVDLETLQELGFCVEIIAKEAAV